MEHKNSTARPSGLLWRECLETLRLRGGKGVSIGPKCNRRAILHGTFNQNLETHTPSPRQRSTDPRRNLLIRPENRAIPAILADRHLLICGFKSITIDTV